MRFSVLVSFFLCVSCAGAEVRPKSDNFDGSRFFFSGVNNDKSLWDVMMWKIKGDAVQWPEWTANSKSNDFSKPPVAGDVQFHFINHATVYIHTTTESFVTDPVWSQRTSPVQFAGPKRTRPAGVTAESLPKLDFVLVSHNHYDHLDTASLVALKNKFDPLFFVPLGDGALLKSLGITKFREMDWHDVVVVGQSEVTFLPAQHWSARGVFDRNKCLWGSYMVKTQGKKVYFAGDTGYGDFFRKIVERYGTMDFAMLPIGAYEPRWFMKDMHMNPEDAFKAHLDLGSKTSLGVHFGTWQLTDEGQGEPALALQKEIAANPTAPPFVIPENGESFFW